MAVDLGAITLDLDILKTIFCHLLWTKYWCYIGMLFCPHGLWPWEIWLWPWNSCGSLSVQINDATLAGLSVIDCPWWVGAHRGVIFLCDLWPWRYDLELGNLVAPTVSSIMMLHWHLWICCLLVNGRCPGHAIFSLGLSALEIWPWPWKSCDSCCVQHIYYIGQLGYVEYPWGVGVHGHVILPQNLWPWSYSFEHKGGGHWLSFGWLV